MTDKDPDHEVAELPLDIVKTYARLWQFETWLRRMVRLELMALKGTGFDQGVQHYEKPKEKDKALHHMSTPETDSLSYAPFSEVIRLIKDNFTSFASYLPPQQLWDGKLGEILQIRHRIAHFRSSHRDDYARVCQLLRDVDQGFWRFCTSFNRSYGILPASSNPVSAAFLEHDPFPWSEIGDRQWARVGAADPSLRIAVTVETIDRIWAEVPPDSVEYPGRLYDVHFLARNQRQFDLIRFLDTTKHLHPSAVYICLDHFASSIRLTLPSILGAAEVISLTNQFLAACNNALTTGRIIEMGDQTVQDIADRWPEVVLGPSNPLTFLSPGMECSFFNV